MPTNLVQPGMVLPVDMFDIDVTQVWQQLAAQPLQVNKPWATGKSAYAKPEEIHEMTKLSPQMIYAYNDYSRGAKALAKELGWQFIRRNDLAMAMPALTEGSFKIINWGNYIEPGHLPDVSVQILNPGAKVSMCGNKVKFFDHVIGKVRIPTYTKELSQALAWVEQGIQVMGRSARGSCGIDIVFYEDDLKRFSESEFWVQYKRKKSEYRIHLAFGKIIAIQQKALRVTDQNGDKIDTSLVDYRIRNLNHGFIFKRHDIAPPTDVMDQAAMAIEAVGLDFGAVDVIYNETEKKAYVLEVNTSPGLEGTTIQDYANAFREHFA